MARKSTHTSEIRTKLAEALDSANQGPAIEITATPMSATTATTAPATAAPAAALCANQIVKSSMILAAGAGAVPVPAWDAALVFGVQLKMLADLSAAYRVPFSENIGKSAVAALLGGLAPALIVQGAAGSVLKGLPVVGGLLSLVAQPALAAAVTYAVGRVFISHYETGGTLLTFDATDFRKSFTDEVKAGLKKAAELKV